MNHQEIVSYISAKHGVGPWWRQMVTATYEVARGLREQHQKPAGYEISVSRTVNTPLPKLYKSVANDKSRNAWLAEDGLVVRKATENKSLRFTWTDGKTSLEMAFSAKGDEKTQIVVQHSKLPDAKSSAKMKAYWGKALDRLRVSLER